MSMFEDDKSKKKVAHEIGSDLALLSVDDLDSRIELLKAEIVRLEEDKVKKQAGRAAADNLFRK